MAAVTLKLKHSSKCLRRDLRPTPLVRACRERGIDACPGFEMMVQQVPEYLSFVGVDDIAKAGKPARPTSVRFSRRRDARALLDANRLT